MAQKSSASDYKLTQLFGDKTALDRLSEEDIISAVKFDQSGRYLSLGDRAGRLIIFDIQNGKAKKSPEFAYFTEFQSHVKEFDYLRSVEIEERVNDIHWLKHQGKNLYVMTTNKRSVKLWRLSHKLMKKVVKTSGKELAIPKMQVTQDGLVPTLKTSFPALHTHPINSLSVSANEQYAITSDDLKIYLWNLEDPTKAFVPLQLKPDNPDEPDELITTSSFHPTSDNLFSYATTKGILKMCDMRVSALCDNTAVNFTYDSPVAKNFFTDIVSSYSSLTFFKNQKYLAARDFLTVKIWDVAMPNKPVTVIPINEGLKTKLCELYESEQIFEKFSLSASPDSKHLITGDFNSNFHIMDTAGNNFQYELNFNKKTVWKQLTNKVENLGMMDYTKKTLRMAYSPVQNIAAVACLNCFFIYSL